MNIKVERISNDITGILSSIPEVDCILLQKFIENDIANPYFFMSFDVYYNGILPNTNERRKLFMNAGAFESSHHCIKDRFFVEDIPVRIEYKQKDRIDIIINNKEDNLEAFHGNGTYIFYRIQTGKVMYKNSDWIETIQNKLNSLSELFWAALRNSFFLSMEHYLVDLSSAAINSDDFFYKISLSGYLENLCSFMFVINRKFEPSGRRISHKIMNLDIFPENFGGRFDTLLRDDPEFPPSRKMEVARLLTKSLIHLY